MTTPTAATPSEPVSPTPEPTPSGAAPTPPGRSGWTAWRVTSVVIGAILGLISLGLLTAGGIVTWATNTQRDSTGFITSDRHHIVTPTAALTSDEVDFANWDGRVTPGDVFGDVRIRATAITASTPVFIGVAAKSDVDHYLAGVNHEVVTEWAPLKTSLRASGGGSVTRPPADSDIWTAKTSGTGTQTLTWRPT